ncbi:hypothetical protein [Nocardiopsis ansamitocini]|uniref:Uncharacterized protein n=1 Tax=Nocardiopsis ansamitocini TaxID=1670832 RepID=A0A9W6P9P2_9ACTN|nr:hypothetical protein [Nocardiopsis ansamitocini]GLU49725.1 hypothetical protein Nans01_40760 [Nocardiopsis ansamitocini]
MDKVGIATAVAGKVAGDLSDGARKLLVALRERLRERFAEHPTAWAALEAARDENGEDPDTVRELAGHITAVEAVASEVRSLTDGLRPHFGTDGGDVTNTVDATVTGAVVQARDIHGGVHL